MSTKDSGNPVIQSDLFVTIPDGETVSDAVDLLGTSLLGFITDNSLNATNFTFKAAEKLDGNYLTLKRMSDGNNVEAIVGANARYATNPADFSSIRFLKIVSNNPQAGADTVIKIVNRRLA